VGTGPLANELKQLVQTYKLASRVVLYGRIEHKHLHQITCSANLGVSIEEDMGLNYRFALPNKIFDYIQAGIPVLASNLPEMAKIIKTHNIGSTIDTNCNSLQLANAIQSMLTNTDKMNTWQANTRIAAATLCWEVEQGKLVNLVENALKMQPS
ncbi:MAG TPA: glycosyltransferase, partial [Tenuifilaceae bacterium]|nr:glycosyltransferase [Tenuifilaceae bacterium]